MNPLKILEIFCNDCFNNNFLSLQYIFYSCIPEFWKQEGCFTFFWKPWILENATLILFNHYWSRFLYYMYTLQERKQKGSCFSEACYFWQILFSKDGYISHPHVPLQCYLVTTLSKNGVYLSPPLNLVGLVITLTNRQWQKSGATYQMQVAHCLWSMIL